MWNFSAQDAELQCSSMSRHIHPIPQPQCCAPVTVSPFWGDSRPDQGGRVWRTPSKNLTSPLLTVLELRPQTGPSRRSQRFSPYALGWHFWNDCASCGISQCDLSHRLHWQTSILIFQHEKKKNVSKFAVCINTCAILKNGGKMRPFELSLESCIVWLYFF